MTEPQTDPRTVSEPGPEGQAEAPAGRAAASAHAVEPPAQDAAAPVPARPRPAPPPSSSARVAAALIWSNVAPRSYEEVWTTELTARVGGHGITMDLREFVNSGLMALFFLVVGPRGAPRVGHGRAAGAQPGGAAVPRRARRHARPDRDLPRLQRRAADRARLGRRDVHRHRVRARRARPGRRQPAARPGAHLPADLLGRRRPGRARGHRRSSTAATCAGCRCSSASRCSRSTAC